MKKTLKAVGLFALLLGTTGCVANPQSEMPVTLSEGEVGVFFISEQSENLVQEVYEPTESDVAARATELYRVLKEQPSTIGCRCAIPEGVELLDTNLENEQYTMVFGESYYNMDSVTEVLCRAAIVRTMLQIDGISAVEFMVNNQPLLDKCGRTVGLMSADTFVESAGSDLASYQEAELNLYFSNIEGNGLVLVKRKVLYHSNMPVEKLIVEQLLRGIESEENGSVTKSSIPTEAKLLKLYVKDGVCYVNFDEKFVTQTMNVKEEVIIYSLVNSLTELPDITKVQISVNGVSNRKFKERVNLNTIFEKDNSYLQ